ncbi:MAG: hypothetical protein WBF20_19735 [Trebonia sp.]|uniref:hypothetical protein n=1 Tax=Trebonia sp. TaxID=2767075 RepID=UPI003BB08B15
MRRPLTVTALSLALVAGILGTVGAGGASAATRSQPAQTCILGICFGPTSSPTPAPSASSSASPNPLPLPSVSLPVGTSLPAGPSASGTAKANGKKAAQKNASADPGLVASAATEVLTAGSATLAHFAYAGNVTLPAGGGGSVSMMKFTADSITLAGGVTDTVAQGGTTTVTSSPTLAFSGGVTLYATKLTGSLLGVPLTFTPSTVSAVLLTIASVLTSSATITMTNVTTDQPIVIAGALQTGQLSIG